ncbi:Paraneoplastic antigen-like protein 5 [Nosema granulosis]|uniref:Paraneoplastic antigen-like protein 5 n=1 Tax=Nosema granulosis TaxID=83296 RepID=A0A9P6KZF0_9MICR|nr:Paraneoplastic antigen-like protein 5 [Nosema granulosis]
MLDTSMSDSNKRLVYMATAIKSLRPFEGEEKEDINTWLRDALLVAEIGNLSKEETIRAITLSLRGKALSWASQVLSGKLNTIELPEIVTLMKKRFGGQQNSDITLTRFLSRAEPTSREDFSEMLKDASVLNERKLISITALAQMIVQKAPSDIKALLYQTSCVVTTWEEFIQKGEEIAWIAFPDKILSRVSAHYTQSNNNSRKYKTEKEFNKPRNTYQTEYCALHGYGNTPTKACKLFTEIMDRERNKLRKSVREIRQTDGEDKPSTDENKNFLYYLSGSRSKTNPCFIKCKINGKIRGCLLDTGADVSLIGLKDVRPGDKLEKYTGLVRSASGEPMKILGKNINCKISIRGNEIVCNPLVMENIGYVILGMDVLREQGALLIDTLKASASIKEGTKSIKSLNECDVVSEYADLFRTEIGDMNLCTAGTHDIDTGDHKPVYSRNSRIALAYESAMDEEIKKLLKLGIIRESKSP